MPRVNILVVTREQERRLFSWLNQSFNIGHQQQCYALKGPRLGGMPEVVQELTELGYRARQHNKIGVVVATIPEERLDVAGERIKHELYLDGWPSEWVTRETWPHFR